jgi:hypothetical protein
MSLTAPELTEVLSSPAFASLLVEANTITIDTDFEAGFAVYHDASGRVSYSDVLHPDEEYIEAAAAADAQIGRLSPQDLLDYLLRMVGDDPGIEMPELNLGQLLTNDNVDLRTDLAVVAHTHPFTHFGRRGIVSEPGRLLRPSSADVINYGDHLASNPGLVEATTATHNILGGTALYLWRGEPEAVQRLGTLTPGREITDKVMDDLGLRHTIVTYDRHTGAVVKGLGSIGKLYE